MKDLNANNQAKQAAGIAAAREVQSGWTVGLGTGSTAAFAIQELARLVREQQLRIECVATSFQARMLALECGLSIVPTDAVSRLNISIDGADEIDPELNLIKGGGAAHTREKIVHAMSDRFIVVADPSKIVSRLGTKFAVPIEVLPDAVGLVTRMLGEMQIEKIQLRTGSGKDGPTITDNGNVVLDVSLNPAPSECAALEDRLNKIPGVVENGIFARYRPRPGDCIIGDPEAPDGVRRL